MWYHVTTQTLSLNGHIRYYNVYISHFTSKMKKLLTNYMILELNKSIEISKEDTIDF